MKRIELLVLALLLTVTVGAAVITANDPPAAQVMLPLLNSGKIISLSKFVNLKPSDYKLITGKKMSFKERISLKILQHYLKKSINKNGTVNLKKFNDEEASIGQLHFLWFALGFLLGPIGLAIALFIQDFNREDRIEWTMIGFGTLLFLFALLILA